MTKHIYYIKTLLLTALIIGSYSCRKYLDHKPSGSLVVPTTVKDLQSLLEDIVRINQKDVHAGERSADDYYLGFADWQGLTEDENRLYTWEKDNLFVRGTTNEWSNIYENVYKPNLVLDGLETIQRVAGDEADYNNTKGIALFTRARSFWQIVTTWSVAYDAASANSDPGIPLRLDPNFNIVSTRASVQACYERILDDLKAAARLLPITPIHVTRPSIPAAYAMLARVYLSMRNYDSAMRYAGLCLQLKSNLLDFNTLNGSNSFPLGPQYSSPEIIFSSQITMPATLTASKAKIDSALIALYNNTNDLRKTMYFQNNNGVYSFRGSMSGGPIFSGLATDEVYLVQAECKARKGDVTGAMTDLNILLSKRWRTNSFVPYSASSSAEALNKILEERRKELVFRCIRFSDIKRLNKEGANIILRRRLNGVDYVLQPNSKRYALEIPQDVIEITGMAQNDR